MPDLRIAGQFQRGPLIALTVDGLEIPAHAGESVAVALLNAGLLRLRTSPRGGSRGAFCHMGVCQECTVEVDGRAVSACLTPAASGMRIVLRRITDAEH